MDEALDEPLRPRAEGELGPAGGAEEVGGERQVRAADLREQQRGAAGGDDAAVDLGRLEAGIHLGLDDGEVAVAPELVEEAAQVGEGEVGGS